MSLHLVAMLLGLVQALMALILLLISEKLDVNPLIGFRASYTMASKKIWKYFNKLAGKILLAIGVGAALIGLEYGVIAGTVFLLFSDIAATIALIEYSQLYAEKQLLTEPAVLAPSRPIPKLGHKLRLLVASISIVSAVLTLVVVADLLSRGLLDTSLILVAFSCVSIYMAILSLQKPEVYAYPWLSDKEYEIVALITPSSLLVLLIGLDLATYGEESLGFIALLAATGLILFEAFVVIYAYARPRRGT